MPNLLANGLLQMLHGPILQMLSLSTPDPYEVYKEILYKISYAYSEPLTKFYISNTLAITVNKASSGIRMAERISHKHKGNS